MSYIKITPVLSIILASCILGCSGKKETPQENIVVLESDEWEELDSFHMIMAESFHPFIDSGNLVPAKANAAAMEDLASKWTDAPLPDKVNNDHVKQLLTKLKHSATNFSTMLTDAPDEVLGDSLTSLHNLFHDIQESWYKNEEHHDH
jgi:hypothetical protein